MSFELKSTHVFTLRTRDTMEDYLNHIIVMTYREIRNFQDFTFHFSLLSSVACLQQKCQIKKYCGYKNNKIILPNLYIFLLF
jgi:hypothetical protein